MTNTSISTKSTVAVIPGTGNIGFGVAHRLAKAGHNVIIGSRDATKAQNAANKILNEFPSANVKAGKSEELPLASVLTYKSIIV